MWTALNQLVDRLGRAVLKGGAKLIELPALIARNARETRATARISRGTKPLTRSGARGHTRPLGEAARAANSGSKPLLQITLHTRQVPALLLLVFANLGLIVTATLVIDRLNRTDANVVLPPTITYPPPPTPAAQASVEPIDANDIASINVVVTPVPAGPTPTAPPNPLSLGGTLYYAYRQQGRTNLWAQVLGRPNPVRLTAGPWDDRDPAISPDGTRLAFASRRDGSWNLYVLDLRTGETQRLTEGLGFKANPMWSPDGQYLVFELYRNDNLDIAIISAQGGEIIPITADRAADYEPAWSPQGREIVWVSMRSGNPELWRLSLDNPDERSYQQLTNTPYVQESEPAYSPNGEQLAYSDAADNLARIYIHAARDVTAGTEAGQGHAPVWSPEGSSLATIAVQENGADYVIAAPAGQPGLAQIAFRITSGSLRSLAWSGGVLPETLPGTLAELQQMTDGPLWVEQISLPRPDADPAYSLVTLPGVTAADPRLSDRVDESFMALRQTTARMVGWDYLSSLDNALVRLDAPLPPSIDYSSWLKTGRAFDLAQAAEQYGWVKIAREDFGFRTYWRVWLLAAVQDGTLGEPLRRPPWNLAARYSGRPEPYDAGGEFFSVMPAGFFVDFTTLAEDYGWTRTSAESNWRSFFPGIMYWRFELRAGMDWLGAMREVYPNRTLATRTPVPSPTNSPTVTRTPTATATRTRVPTRTITPTMTRRPTLTITPTMTRRPTLTPTPSWTPRGTWFSQTPTVTPTLKPTSTQIADP